MIIVIIIFLFILINNSVYNKYNNYKNNYKKYTHEIGNGIYTIKSLINNQYFSIKNNKIFLSKKQINFRLIHIKSFYYYIESTEKKKNWNK